jgi:hypothetical protein
MGPDMRRFAAASRVILVVLGGLRASATASSEVCGRPNAPPCALQAWMRARMAQPYARPPLRQSRRQRSGLATFNPDLGGWWRDGDRLAREATRLWRTTKPRRCTLLRLGAEHARRSAQVIDEPIAERFTDQRKLGAVG